MKQLRIFFLCLVAATLVTACGGDDKDNSTPVEKITLDKETLLLNSNSSETLTATVTPASATENTVTWSSDKTTVVTVDQNGKVNALTEGTATVTATAGGKSATCVVTVSDAVIINAPEQLQVAFEDASTNPDSPTKIRLGAGFELELCYGETSDPHRYIELDGGGFTLSNVTGSESDVVTIESTTLKLSNIKMNTTDASNCVIALYPTNTKLILGSGAKLDNPTGRAVYVFEGCQLIMDEGSSVNGRIVLQTNKYNSDEGGSFFYKGGTWENTELIFSYNNASTLMPMTLTKALANPYKLTFVAQWVMRPSHFPEGGFTVVKGDGYTLTQLDLEKITSLEMDVTGSSVTSENCELVLDTAENAIKLRIKATAY